MNKSKIYTMYNMKQVKSALKEETNKKNHFYMFRSCLKQNQALKSSRTSGK